VRDWLDENGDWLRNSLYRRLAQTTISCGACPRFHPGKQVPSTMQNGDLRRIAVLLLPLLALGCRLPFRDGPVPQAVANSRRLSQQGAAALDRGEQQKAEALLARAVEACPVDPEARQRYAESLWQRAARKEAVAQMEEACKLNAEDATLWARLGEMQLAEGKVEAARQDAERAIGLDPHLAAAWAVHGGVMQAAGRFPDALADYLRALNYAPKDRHLLLAVAEVHLRQRQPDRALQTMQTLTETYSPGETPPSTLAVLGQVYAFLGRYDEAAESFAAAARKNPTPDALCTLGEAELRAGRAAAAAAAARQALAIQPQHQPSRQLLNRIELAERPSSVLRR
jgi:tetratricopeptide (TPR) repeat protein